MATAINTLNKLCLTLLLTLTVGACGFQLRDNVSLPDGIEPIYLAGDKQDQLFIELSNLLTASGVQLTEEAHQANHQLLILKSEKDKRTASLGSGARVAEYLLIETVSFEMLDKKGQAVFGPVTLSERKIMQNDPNKVVSSQQEETLLRKEMLQNLAAKIARQVGSFNYKKAPQKTPNDPSATDTIAEG